MNAGVSLCAQTGRYKARLMIGKREIWLGRHDTPEEAHAAYVEAARTHWRVRARGMRLPLLLGSLAAALLALISACSSGPAVVHEFACPTEPPPEISDLPKRPGDLRALVPDRHVIEGLWEGIKTRQAEYRKAWDACPRPKEP